MKPSWASSTILGGARVARTPSTWKPTWASNKNIFIGPSWPPVWGVLPQSSFFGGSRGFPKRLTKKGVSKQAVEWQNPNEKYVEETSFLRGFGGALGPPKKWSVAPKAAKTPPKWRPTWTSKNKSLGCQVGAHLGTLVGGEDEKF